MDLLNYIEFFNYYLLRDFSNLEADFITDKNRFIWKVYTNNNNYNKFIKVKAVLPLKTTAT